MKFCRSLLTAVLSVLILGGCATAGGAGFNAAGSAVLTERGVNPGAITDEFALSEAIATLGLPVYDGILRSPDNLTMDEAVMHTVAAAGMTELALTFSPEKSSRILAGYSFETTGDPKFDQTAAAALSTGLVDPVWYARAEKAETPDGDDISYLLQSALGFQGDTADCLGRLSDPSIYKAIRESWNSYDIVQAIDLLTVVDEAVIQGIVTGYNILDSRDDSSFDPALTVTYGHSDIKHALQLVGLLRSEGLDASVDFQGKTSAFLYLEEWGTPVESETFMVKQIPGGNYVAYSKEYNLMFEFDSAADKEEFNRVVLAYAKKDSADEPGLIYGSWWQPLYYSATPMGDGFRTITDNVITSGLYTAHPFSLNDQVETVTAGFRSIDPDIDMESREFWVNQAFYNYLQGEFK